MTVPFDELSASKIAAAAGGAWDVATLPSVTSTQDVVRQMAATNSAKRLAVVADHQEQGRGQAGRIWNAPVGCCLLMSVAIQVGLSAAQLEVLPALASLASADGILDSTGVPIALHWPNDLTIGTSKVGGILTEASWSGNTLELVAIGIGVNVNAGPDDLPHLSPNAASLMQQLDRPVDRNILAGSILLRLNEGVRALQASDRGADEIISQWRSRLGLEGTSVRVSAGQYLGAIGNVESIFMDGRLRIDTGAEHIILRAGSSSIAMLD